MATHYTAEVWRKRDGVEFKSTLSAMTETDLIQQVVAFMVDHDPSGVSDWRKHVDGYSQPLLPAPSVANAVQQQIDKAQ